MSLVLGIDIGTSKICSCLVDRESGELVDVISSDNREFLPSSTFGERAQDSEKILKVIDYHYKSFISKGSIPDAIGISGQMHGIVYIDARGSPVSPLFTWQDMRAEEILETGSSCVSCLRQITGSSLSCGYGSVTHFYHCYRNRVPAGAVTFCTIGDLAALSLTREKTPVLHPSQAAGLGLFDPEHNVFDEDRIAEARKVCARGSQMALSFFPAVSCEPACVGETKDGIPVFISIGDNQASFAGSVRDTEKTLLVNVGTGGQISCKTEKSVVLRESECRPYFGGDFLWVGSSLCGGRALALLEQFFRKIAAGAGAAPDHMYEWIDRLSERAPDLENPLQFNTQFDGTRSDPHSFASIQSLRPENFTPEHFVAGILQGVADELVSMYRQAEKHLDFAPSFLVGSGNGLRKNRVWRDVFSRKLEAPLLVPICKEEAAFGAALYAMVSAGFVTSLAQAQKLIRYTDD